MKKITIAICALWGLSISLSVASEPTFPQTENEIVVALSFKDTTDTHNGFKYESINGRVYKIVNNRRVRMRGLGGIVDSIIVPRVAASINFKLNSDKILVSSYSLLDEYGKALNNDLNGATLQIEGHTDDSGSEEHNMVLSRSRANAVVYYLTKHHDIPTHRLFIKAFGESHPISTNFSDEGRAKNRRVEFVRIE